MSFNSQGTNSNHKNFDDSESVITTSSILTRKIENLSSMAMNNFDNSNFKACIHLIKSGHYSNEELLERRKQLLERSVQLSEMRNQILEIRGAIQERMERNMVNQNAARLFEEVIDVKEEQRQPKQSENCFFGMLFRNDKCTDSFLNEFFWESQTTSRKSRNFIRA